MSVDGFTAGPSQSEALPFGEGAVEGLHRWMLEEPEANAGAIDELRLHVVPLVLGRGEWLFDGVGALDLEPLDVSGTDLVTHLSYRVLRSARRRQRRDPLPRMHATRRLVAGAYGRAACLVRDQHRAGSIRTHPFRTLKPASGDMEFWSSGHGAYGMSEPPGQTINAR